MLDLGIIWLFNSHWTSPLHLFLNVHDSWNTSGDYQALNSVIKQDCCPIPLIHNIVAVTQGKQFLTKIDLIRVYHWILVELEYIPKTSITTTFHLYEFLCISFSLHNDTQYFH